MAAELRQRAPDDADLLLRVAALYDRLGDTDAALEALERAAVRAPSDFRPHLLAARIAQRAGRGTHAAESWARAFARQAPLSHLDEAFTSLPLGIWWVQALETASPVYSYRLAIKLRSSDPEAARLAMDQAALAAPNYYGHRPEQAALWAQTGDAEAAVQLMRDGLLLKPDNPGLLEALGKLAEARGDHAQARDWFLAAAKQRPVLRLRALRAVEKADGAEAALARFDTWRRLGPVVDPVSLEAARIHFRAGDMLGCLEVIERFDLVSSHSVGPQAQAMLGYCER